MDVHGSVRLSNGGPSNASSNRFGATYSGDDINGSDERVLTTYSPVRAPHRDLIAIIEVMV